MKFIFVSIYNYIKNTDKLFYGLCLTCAGLSISFLLGMYNSGLFTNFRVVETQIIAAVLGLFCTIILSKFNYHTIANLWKLHVPLAYFLVLLTFVFGVGRDNVDDVAWLPMPFIGGTIQPSEFLKISFIVVFALHLSKVQTEINQPKVLIGLILHGFVPISLVMLQGDAGTALVFAFIFVSMLFVAGISWKYVFSAMAAGVAALPLVWFFVLDQDKRNRFMVLFNPDLDPQGAGWQQITGRIAIGSGQLWGNGIFSGKHQYVPEIYNDFMFSFIGEAVGFVGCMLVLALLLGICFKILLTSQMAHDYLGRYICVGVFAMLAFQMVANIGMCIGLMPVIGLTLPFFSSGGSSMLANFLAAGVVLSVYMSSKSNLFTNK